MALFSTHRFLLCLFAFFLFAAVSCSDNEKKDQSFNKLLTSKAASSSLKMQSEQVNHTLLYGLIPVMISFSFFVFIFYRTKRENFFKQKETELRLNISEMEMKALRAQINPHFIFNCLNSVHHYMHRNDINLASDYLIKFSQLIRHVLETSSSRMIALSDDLFALELYIQLEQLRMDQSFVYEINVDPNIDGQSVQIPSMLIQPFVENSIWHGLNRKGQGGKLKIDIERQDDIVSCIIEDNGVLQDINKEHYDLTTLTKKTSLGMSLINERLSVIRVLYDKPASFVISDLYDEQHIHTGKRVNLRLPYID